MATTHEGKAIPCGGCPGGYYCGAIGEQDNMYLWEMPTIEGGVVYGCEFVDEDGISTTPTIVRLVDGEHFGAPTPGVIAQSRLFEKHEIGNPRVYELMAEVGELCLRRIKLCPGARPDYTRQPSPDICPAGLGQASVEFFTVQLNIRLARKAGG